MIWDGYRHESWRFVRVSWPGFEELGPLEGVTGGRLEFGSLTDLRSSGTLERDGATLPDDELVRVYYSATDETGETVETALGTFFVSSDSPTFDGRRTHGSMSLQSVLMVPMSAKCGRPYTVKKGANAVAEARAVIEGLGLRTNRPQASYTLSKDAVFDPDDSLLTVVNGLLSMAGYGSCSPDAYGTVCMAPYVDPQERPCVWTFADGSRSIMLPEVQRSDNARETPNVVRLYHETEEESLWASASNIDPGHRASTVSRGYEVTLCESVNELAGDTAAERSANLVKQAEEKLKDGSALIEYVEWGHPWVPLWPGDSVGVEYEDAGLSWKGSVVLMQVDVGGHASCTTRSRRFLRGGFKISTDGGSW